MNEPAALLSVSLFVAESGMVCQTSARRIHRNKNCKVKPKKNCCFGDSFGRVRAFVHLALKIFIAFEAKHPIHYHEVL